MASVEQTLREVLEPTVDLAVQTVRNPVPPTLLSLVAVLFLVLQNRADRKDPKLADAPVWRSRHVSIPVGAHQQGEEEEG